ncbi:MAG: hypothetical protein LBH80_00700, partial [Prevotellaceae bacterium]|nr:hypothetical protein [Prevotellaceae bacterium]
MYSVIATRLQNGRQDSRPLIGRTNSVNLSFYVTIYTFGRNNTVLHLHRIIKKTTQHDEEKNDYTT